jgi:hypothetical protein
MSAGCAGTDADWVSIPIARRSEIFCCDGGVLQFPDVVLWLTDEATRRRVDPVLCNSAGSTRDMPAAGFVRQGAGAVRRGGHVCAEMVTSRAAVVGGFPAGGLRCADG